VKFKTLQWARGLRASLRDEIDSLVSSGVTDPLSLERVVNFRQQLQQVETLVDALEAQFPEMTPETTNNSKTPRDDAESDH
jgi:hypothetical protein